MITHIEKDKRVSFIQVLSLLAVIVILLIMLSMAPLRLDDWAWGGSIGVDRFKSGFEGYNGRYAGDLVVIILTRIPAILRAVIETAILASVVYNSYQILSKSKIAFAVFFILLPLMPLEVFTQTITWTSGFANFTFSLAILLYLMRVFLQIDAGAERSKAGYAFILVIVLIGQLFLENITLYTICLCFLFLVRSIKKRSKARAFFLLALFAAAGGALMMFSNSAYASAMSENGDTYKTISVIGNGVIGTIKKLLKVFANDVIPFWVSSCGPACIMLCLGGISISALSHKKTGSILATIGILLLAACIYAIVDSEWFETIEHGIYFSAFLYSILYFYLIVVLLLFSKDRFRTLFIICSQVFIVGPLLFVNPIGPRCFLASYVLWCLIAAMLIKQAVVELCDTNVLAIRKEQVHSLTVASFAFVFAVLSCSTFAQSLSWHVYDLRAQATEYAIEHQLDTLELPEVPKSRYYCFGANVSNDNSYWIGNYKEYYSIPDEIDVTFCPYSDFDAKKYGIDG